MKNSKEELQRLKDANLPRLDWRDLFTIKAEDGREPLSAGEEKSLSEYFSHFVKTDDGRCLCCGEKQGGDIMDAFLGVAKFTWGIAHGEGTTVPEPEHRGTQLPLAAGMGVRRGDGRLRPRAGGVGPGVGGFAERMKAEG